MPGHKLSTRLLTAYVGVILASLLLVALPLQALLRRDYVSRAAARFEREANRQAAEFSRAVARQDRAAADRLCDEINSGFDGRTSLGRGS